MRLAKPRVNTRLVARETRRRKAEALHNEGKSFDEIRTELAVSVPTLRGYLRDSGIALSHKERIEAHNGPTDWIARCEELEKKYPAWKAHLKLMKEWTSVGDRMYHKDAIGPDCRSVGFFR